MSNKETTNKQSQMYSIGKQYDVKAEFEISVSTCGCNFLVIYGKHVNGYFCCIPNWNIACEMVEPSNVFYNRSKLKDAFGEGEYASVALIESIADDIAKAIRDTHKVKNLNLQFRDCCPCIQHGVECPYPEIIDCELCCYGQDIDD